MEGVGGEERETERRERFCVDIPAEKKVVDNKKATIDEILAHFNIQARSVPQYPPTNTTTSPVAFACV